MNSDQRKYAAPVRRDPFTYSPQQLEVDRIPCCSSERLYSLLTWKDTGPVLTKAGKPRVHQPPRHRDESAAFYHAQCIHYGLKAPTTKAPAKKVLLEALESNNRRLTVPESIRKVEEELIEEYAAANEAAKQKYEQAKLERVKKEQERRMKRKREDEEIISEITKSGKKAKVATKSTPLNLQKIAAQYKVVASYLRDNFGSSSDGDMTLAIASEQPHKVMYGTFDFGAYEGYLRSTNIDKSKRTITFHWRGRETGEGESTFSRSNQMRLQFLDDRTFKGVMKGDCFDECDVMGKYDADASADRVVSWKYQYDRLNEENYERERVGRWH